MSQLLSVAPMSSPSACSTTSSLHSNSTSAKALDLNAHNVRGEGVRVMLVLRVTTDRAVEVCRLSCPA